ncbi:MAG: hypothetical protein Q8O67_27865 [Deltaproteobacteria bacterium]|nr:hypothetical protein [Deltaproteobacteria bacterium]
MNVAEGNLAKLIIALIIAAVVVVGGTVVTPWSAEYEVKTAAKIACSALIIVKKFKDKDNTWEQTFIKKAQGAGVQLKKGQYLFDMQEVKNEGLWRCRFKAAWRSTTPWLALSGVFPEMPPLVYVNRIDKTFDIMNSY